MPTSNAVIDALQHKIDELKAQEEAQKAVPFSAESVKKFVKAPSTSDISEFKTAQDSDALSMNIGNNLVIVLIKNTIPTYTGVDGIVYIKDAQGELNKEPESAFSISSELISENQVTSFLETIAVALFLHCDPSQLAHLLTGLDHQERPIQDKFPQNFNQLKAPVS